MDLKIIKEILADREDILNVKIDEATAFRDTQYEFLIIAGRNTKGKIIKYPTVIIYDLVIQVMLNHQV